MPTRAIIRQPGPAFVDGLTSAHLGKPDWSLALRQHGQYQRALERAGLEVTVLSTEPDFPDCPFVEDTAVVTAQGAVITNPGAPSRNGEQRSVRSVLAQFLSLVDILPPGTLDGGDVLRIEDRFVIGLSQRTNRQGAGQLANHLRQWGYESECLEVGDMLHLKSGVNYIGRGNLLVTRALADQPLFASLHRVLVDDEEAYAANSIFVHGTLLLPAGFPRVQAALGLLGYSVVTLDLSEFRKVDGGMTCLSVLF